MAKNKTNRELRQRLEALEAKSGTSDNPAGDPAWTTTNPGGLFGLGFARSHTNIPVSWQTALASSAVYACVKCLSEDTAKLPLDMLRVMRNGNKREESRHPLVKLLSNPNDWMTPFEFWKYIVTSHQLRGNGYAYIVRDSFNGNPIQLIPVNPDRVSVSLTVNGSLRYSFNHPLFRAQSQINCDSGDMIHIKGMMLADGFMGISPITAAADAVGLALATQRHAALMYGQGTMMGGVLSHPGKLSKEAGERITSSWSAAYSGGVNAHKIGLLEEGMAFTPITMSSVDAELIAARKFSIVEIARLFRVPLTKIGDDEHATFNNVEAQELAYYTDGLHPITSAIEQALRKTLLFDDERERFDFRFDFDEMLRADMKTRFAAYQQAILSGWMSADEIRASEGMEPIPGGQGAEFRFPVNTAPGAAPSVNSPEQVLNPDQTADPDAQEDDDDDKDAESDTRVRNKPKPGKKGR